MFSSAPLSKSVISRTEKPYFLVDSEKDFPFHLNVQVLIKFHRIEADPDMLSLNKLFGLFEEIFVLPYSNSDNGGTAMIVGGLKGFTSPVARQFADK